MAAETYSYTGSRVAQDVRDKFGDIGAVQISDDMLLRWINDGQRQIGQSNPFLQETAQAALLAGQAAYPFAEYFPGKKVLQFEAITVNGNRAEVLSFGDFNRRISTTALADVTDSSVTYATVFGGTITIWPTPQESIPNGLSLYYIALPADLTALSDALTVPDRFYNSLQNFVLGQALILSEDFAPASAVLQASHDQARMELNREDVSPTDFYPSITDVSPMTVDILGEGEYW